MQRPLVNLVDLPAGPLATAFLLHWPSGSWCWERAAIGTRNHGSKHSRLGGPGREPVRPGQGADLELRPQNVSCVGLAEWGVLDPGDSVSGFWAFPTGEECRAGGHWNFTGGVALGKGPPWAWSGGAPGGAAPLSRVQVPGEANLGTPRTGVQGRGVGGQSQATYQQPHLPRLSGPKFWARWSQGGHLEHQTVDGAGPRLASPQQPTPGSEPTKQLPARPPSPARSRLRTQAGSSDTTSVLHPTLAAADTAFVAQRELPRGPTGTFSKLQQPPWPSRGPAAPDVPRHAADPQRLLPSSRRAH